MTPAPLIRAGPAHAAAMAAIHGEAFPTAPWDTESFEILLGQPGVVGLLDERGGLALLRIVADEAEILTIAVTARRRGWGRRLMAAAAEAARLAGARQIFLEVAATNVAARGLYAALGYTEVGRRQAYYQDGADAVVLRLALENG